MLLNPLLTELSWTHNLLILGKCKRDEEREFYPRLAHGQKWTSRELERQINGALFERTILSPAKLSAALTELHPDAAAVFKDAYLLDFLDLPPQHTEDDLQQSLVKQLKQFLTELGRDFCFVGSKYPLQVGGRDFALDLLFFTRIAQYADDPARLDDLYGRITAFRLSCCFERLKRAGRFEDVFIDDPFDPEGSVSVELTEAQWQAIHAAAPPRDASHGQYGFSRN